MASPLTNVGFTPTAGGTTDWTYSSANPGYQSPVAGNVVNGGTYEVFAKDASNNWEISRGVCTISVGIPTFARTTVLYNSAGTGTMSPGQSGAGTKINFGTVPAVSAVLIAEDLVFINPPQGRLTLATGVPVMNSSQASKTTIFYTPYVGNQVPIYDGVSFRNVAFAEFSTTTTDTTKNPAAIGVGKVNDWFIWDDAGTTRLCHGPDWTNDNTRSAGTALTMVNGILLNSVAITNGPGASRGTYVGTTRSDGASQLNHVLGGSGSGGVTGILLVWNAYNRRHLGGGSNDTGASYTYTSNVIRVARGSGGNSISFVTGLSEDVMEAFYSTEVMTTANAASAGIIGIGYDSQTTFASQRGLAFTNANAIYDSNTQASFQVVPTIGVHTIYGIEGSDNVHANTFNVNSTASLNVVLQG